MTTSGHSLAILVRIRAGVEQERREASARPINNDPAE